MERRKILGYLFYGGQREYKLELFFSIYSALKHLVGGSDGVTVSVITDQSDFDPDLPIDVVSISSAELAEWTQNGTYNHRAKGLAALKMLDHYQCPVVMVDTDTHYLQNPAQLFERISPATTVMHSLEEQAIEKDSFYMPLVKKLGDGIEVEGITISGRSPMFNSGVIGIEPSHRSLLEKAIPIMDKIYGLHPLFSAEQLAIGLVLNHHTQVLSSDDVVYHYHGPYRYFVHAQAARLLKDFSAETLKQVLDKPFPDRIGFPPLSRLDRAIARLYRTLYRWHDTYRFAYLAYRAAFSCAAQEEDYANAWVKTVLHDLKMAKLHNFSLSSARRDFRRLQPDRLDQLPWLYPDVKAAMRDFWQTIA